MLVTVNIMHIMVSYHLISPFKAKCSDNEDNMGKLCFNSLRAHTLGNVALFVEALLGPGSLSV